MRIKADGTGALPLGPPHAERYCLAAEFRSSALYIDNPHLRDITSKNGGGPPDFTLGPCAWCARPEKPVFTYDPRDFGWQDEDVCCCCWQCYFQLLAWREEIANEIEMFLSFGVRPEFIPHWYFSAEVLQSLVSTARTRMLA